MRCLHCGKQLSLLRRASGSEFCSRAHEQKYVEEQESLAISRLIESKREALAAQARRGGGAPHPRGLRAVPELVEKFFPVAPRSRAAAAADWRCPAPLEAQTTARMPGAGLQVVRDNRTPGCADLQVPVLEALETGRPAPVAASEAPALRQAPPAFPRQIRVLPGGCAVHPAAFRTNEPEPADACSSNPAPALGILARPKMGFPDGPVALGAASLDMAGASSAAEELTPITGEMPTLWPPPEARVGPPAPATHPRAGLAPAPPEHSATLQADPPAAGFLVRIRLSTDCQSARILGERLATPAVAPRLAVAQSPRGIPGAGIIGQEPVVARARPSPRLERAEETTLPWRHGPPELDGRTVHASLEPALLEPTGEFSPVAVNGNGAQPVPVNGRLEPGAVWRAPGVKTPASPGVSPAPRLEFAGSAAPADAAAAGCDGVVHPWPLARENPAPLQETPACPAAETGIPLAACPEFEDHPHPPAGLLSAGLDHILAKEDRTRPEAFCRSVPVVPQPWMPAASLTPAPPEQSVEAAPFRGSRWRNAWGALAARCRSAPGVVKWVAVALPLFVAPLLRYPGETATPTGEARRDGNQVAAGGQFSSWRQTISSRAAIRLEDDFRSGLAAWKGAGNWAETWSYDPAGLVYVGRLALYRPSASLSDYRMEFTGQLERGGMGWVFRAQDERNYHAMKLAIVEPGPLSKAVLIHFTVIEGKPGPRSRTPLPFLLGPKALRQVRVDVNGENFAIYMESQLVHYWADERLPSGGIGFFAESGDQFRLRWVSVTHQNDILGRLCALLAPPGQSTKEPPKQ